MNLKKTMVFLSILWVFMFSTNVVICYGQRLTGKITGKVTDEENAVLPGVKVDLSSSSLIGGVHSQVTTEKGTYRFANLPPGTYKLVFNLEGFQNVIRENVKLSVNKTVTENIVMKFQSLEESIVVTSDAPIVDVTSSGISSNFSKEQIEKLPAGRYSFFDIVKQAPGVVQQRSRSVSFGSNMESNAYQLDGVDVSNPETGVPWHFYLNQDNFEEVEALGIGSPAEYGNFTGAVINVVTKSGGNAFSGSFSYYGQYQSLTGDNNPDPEEWNSFHRDKYLDLSFTLGGPIVKDRFWFFATFRRLIDSNSEWQGDPEFPTQRKSYDVLLKLTAQIAPSHKLSGSINCADWIFPSPITPYITPEAVGSQMGDMPTWSILYTWLISTDAFLELKYAGYRNDFAYQPTMGGDKNIPTHLDAFTGVISEAPIWTMDYWTRRHQVNANISYFAEDFFGGDHDFRFGIQYTRGTSDTLGGYSGSQLYYDFAGYPYFLIQRNPYHYGGIVDNVGAFVDDSVKIGDRLTVNLGLRFDHKTARVPEYTVMDGWTETPEIAPGIDDLITWNVLSPRIGLAYQLTSDQKTLLKASYGRYYDNLHIAHFGWPGPAVADQYIYFWTGADWLLIDFTPGSMGYSVDPNLRNPYADQFSIGVERELIPNFSIGITGIYKNEKNLIGWEDRGATYVQTDVESPTNGQRYSAWNQTSDMASNDYWLANPSDYYGYTYGQKYWGAIFELKKRYSNNWQLFASITLSKSEGLNSASGGMWQEATVMSTGAFGRDPNDLLNAESYLNFDQRWIFKLQASYSFPFGILASLNYLYHTGRPIPTFVRVLLNQGPRTILEEPRGGERFDSTSLLDIRLQKSFNIYKNFRLHLMADVFNAFNSDTVEDYASYNLWSSAYRVPSRMLYPRRLQVAVRLEF